MNKHLVSWVYKWQTNVFNLVGAKCVFESLPILVRAAKESLPQCCCSRTGSRFNRRGKRTLEHGTEAICGWGRPKSEWGWSVIEILKYDRSTLCILLSDYLQLIQKSEPTKVSWQVPGLHHLADVRFRTAHCIHHRFTYNLARAPGNGKRGTNLSKTTRILRIPMGSEVFRLQKKLRIFKILELSHIFSAPKHRSCCRKTAFNSSEKQSQLHLVRTFESWSAWSDVEWCGSFVGSSIHILGRGFTPVDVSPRLKKHRFPKLVKMATLLKAQSSFFSSKRASCKRKASRNHKKKNHFRKVGCTLGRNTILFVPHWHSTF